MSRLLLVEGARACFRRPELKDDLVSYDTITPPAARTILRSFMPQVRGEWSIRAIHVLNPIRRGWLEQHTGSRIYALQDVAYVIDAEIVGGHHEAVPTMATAEPAKTNLFLGLREFPATARLLDGLPPSDNSPPDQDLGWLPFDTGRGPGRRATFFRADLSRGIIDLTKLTSADFAT